MRATQKLITSHPKYSQFDGPCGRYGKLSFSNPTEAFNLTQKLLPISIERDLSGSWRNQPERAGLESQTLADYDQSHIARVSLALTQKAEAKLPHKHTRFAQPHAALTGGFWDTPSVIAGLPLAARTRKRAKLPPKDIRIAFFFSAGINAASMAPRCAKIARAIWDYTLAGGAVNLTVFHCEGESPANNKGTGTNGLVVETKVNCSDVATVSLVLSPVYMRLTVFPIQSAHSDAGSGIPFPTKSPVPNCLFIGGPMEAVYRACDEVCKSLEIIEG